MVLVLEILLSGFSALGVVFLGWWLLGWLLRPSCLLSIRVVIPGRGEGEGLEQTLRFFRWLRGLGLFQCSVVIADVDLTPAGWQLALALARHDGNVVLWPASDLHDYIGHETEQ